VTRANCREIRLEPIVVPLGNRVVLVVVAPGTAHREAEDRRSDGVRNVVEYLLAAQTQVAGIALVGIMATESGRHKRVRLVWIQLISGDLLLDEAVIGLV